ncbi:MAG: helix-turn-helix transcriptional regulator [Thermodesulfobacteriota bacterium]|nr:MAG: helix-turn-helix transcriptional regulator [Thermodesulfobacteriota bacterium]
MKKDMNKLFGNRIKSLRKRLGYSQEKLAEMTEISSKYLSRLETGDQFPSLEVLERLAENLNVEPKDLFEFYHEEQSPRKLKETLTALITKADEEELRILVRIARAILK